MRHLSFATWSGRSEMKARRLPVVDEYVHGDQVAVFVDGRVLVLSVVASTVLSAVGETWRSISAIASDVIVSVGEPPVGSPEDAVAGVLSDLAELALVEVSK